MGVMNEKSNTKEFPDPAGSQCNTLCAVSLTSEGSLFKYLQLKALLAPPGETRCVGRVRNKEQGIDTDAPSGLRSRDSFRKPFISGSRHVDGDRWPSFQPSRWPRDVANLYSQSLRLHSPTCSHFIEESIPSSRHPCACTCWRSCRLVFVWAALRILIFATAQASRLGLDVARRADAALPPTAEPKAQYIQTSSLTAAVSLDGMAIEWATGAERKAKA